MIVEKLGRRIFYGWAIVVALGVTTIISYGTSQYLFGVLVAPLAGEFGWPRAALGGAYAGMVLVAGIAGPFAGALADRIGARLLLAAGSALSGVSLLLTARVHSLAQLDLIWTLGLGVGTALTWYPVTFTVVANWFDERRPHALSTLTFMGAFASTVFYPLAGLLTASLGWRPAVEIMGLVQLCIALPVHAFIVRRHPEDHGLHPDGAARAGEWTPQSGVTLPDALRSAAFWTITLALALGAFASTIVLLQQIAYLIARGVPLAPASSLVGLFGIAYLPGRWLVMRAHGRVDLAWQLALAFVAQAAGVVLLAFAHGIAAAVAYVLVFGAAYGATAPLRAAIVAERFGRRAYGAIVAAQGVPIGVLAALGPLVSGALIDRLGYGAAFTACVAAFVAAAAIVAVERQYAGGE